MSPLAKFCDLDLEDWQTTRHQVRLSSFWCFDNVVGGYQLDGRVAEQLLLRYTQRDDVVLDLLLGSGTMLFQSLLYGRRCVGVDINGGMVERVRSRLGGDVGRRVLLVEGDSANRDFGRDLKDKIRGEMGREYAQFVLLHPPYFGCQASSGENEMPGDLSLVRSVGEYLDLFYQVASRALCLLEPGRFAALVIGDTYRHGDLVPMSSMCVLRMLQAGFRTKCWFVKNWERSEERGLWEYRALRGGYNVFEHEHVIVFKKPVKGGKVSYCYG